MSADRPPHLDLDDLSEDQKLIYEKISSGPRGAVQGPLLVWLHSPGLAARAEAFGAYCRYGTVLPPRLSELAILVTGAYWRSGFEWEIHCPIALQAGLTLAQVEAIKVGEAPVFEDQQARIVYSVSQAVHVERNIPADLYAESVAVLGLPALVDLIGILGYYTLISMTINVFGVPVPEGCEESF